jgi:hypothetical protein
MPLTLPHSGDDHDYCHVTHNISSSQSIPEISIKSLSMAMGVGWPGYELVSLLNADPSASDAELHGRAFEMARPCTLPNQIKIYTHFYAPLALLSIIVLVASRYPPHFLSRRRRRARRGFEKKPSSAAGGSLPSHHNHRRPISSDAESSVEESQESPLHHFPQLDNFYYYSYDNRGEPNSSDPDGEEGLLESDRKVRRVSRIGLWSGGGGGGSGGGEPLLLGRTQGGEPFALSSFTDAFRYGPLNRFVTRPVARITRRVWKTLCSVPPVSPLWADRRRRGRRRPGGDNVRHLGLAQDVWSVFWFAGAAFVAINVWLAWCR